MAAFKPALADCLLVALGSGAGGLARYLLGGWVSGRTGPGFPWGTFVVNVSGCFLLGLLMGVLGERQPTPWPGWRLLLGVGFLGGYTTFSTLMYETWRLGPRVGGLNFLASGAAGYLATLVGARLARGG